MGRGLTSPRAARAAVRRSRRRSATLASTTSMPSRRCSGQRRPVRFGLVSLVDEDFLRRCADGMPGAEIADGAFGPGPAVWVGRREVAHIDSADVLDIRLTRSVIRAERDVLRSDPRVTLRHGSSDWLEFEVSSIEDLAAAADLVAQAIAANLPSAPRGAAGRP